MDNEKSRNLRLQAMEAQLAALEELMGVALRAIIQQDPDALRATLHVASQFSGPSRAHQAMSRIAQTALTAI